jgi:hypothetical protein
MTTTSIAPAIFPAKLEDEGSAVAVTLSWPPEPGHGPDAGGASPARGMHIIELIGDIDVQLAARVRDLLTLLPARDATSRWMSRGCGSSTRAGWAFS